MIFVSFFKVELTQLGKIFNTIVEVFLFLDKNGDGKLNKKDVDKTLNDTYPWERSPANITRIRFSIYLLHFVNIVFMFFFLVLLSLLNSLFCLSFFAEEMDWDRNGKVTFREFLFGFLKWVGIDEDELNHQTEGHPAEIDD